jgi:hypothetical protein
MDYSLIGFLTFLFCGFTLLNRIIEGAFITTADITILNQLTVIRSIEIPNLFSVPVLNLDFFIKGLPNLVNWNYSFFGGPGAIIQFFLYSFTAAVAFGCFLTVIGLFYNYFSHR